MAPMPSMKSSTNKPNTNYLFATNDAGDSSSTPSSPPSSTGKNEKKEKLKKLN